MYVKSFVLFKLTNEQKKRKIIKRSKCERLEEKGEMEMRDSMIVRYICVMEGHSWVDLDAFQLLR
jgi:hypothetical protein